jgi:THO complex subunit 1
MPTAYEAKVSALTDAVLAALAAHADAGGAAAAILAAASPGGDAGSPPRAPPPAEAALLSHAALAAVLRLAEAAAAAGTQLMAHGAAPGRPPAVAALADALLALAAPAPPLADAALPALVLEAALEAAPGAEAAGVLAFLDSRLAELRRPAVMARSKHTLLRAVNTLLRRLSRSADAALCGRALFFLAKFLPLTERSGVNHLGAFAAAGAPALEEVAEGALDAEGNPVDAAFYRSFWGLQSWFADPPAALAPAAWPALRDGLGAALDRFAAERVTVGEAPAGETFTLGAGSEGEGGDGGDGGAAAAAAGDGDGAAGAEKIRALRFLTSARLLPLQLRDATLRRHVLLQALALLQWLERPALREHAARALAGRPLEELAALRGRVWGALEATPPRGHEFAAGVRRLMAGEDAWAAWKAAACPPEPLERPPAAAPPGAAGADIFPPRAARKRSREDAPYGVHLGSAELDRLWNLTEDNTSSALCGGRCWALFAVVTLGRARRIYLLLASGIPLRSCLEAHRLPPAPPRAVLGADDRGGFKSVRQLMEPVVEEARDAAAAAAAAAAAGAPPPEEDPAGLISRDRFYGWKALRLVARDSLPAYAEAVRAGGDLRVAARLLYPDEVPPAPAAAPGSAAAAGEGAEAEAEGGAVEAEIAAEEAAAEAAAVEDEAAAEPAASGGTAEEGAGGASEE